MNETRCGKCRVLTGRKRGGTPCIPDHYIPQYKKEFGRSCPRVELLTVNEDASQIVMLALNQYTQPLLPAYLSIMNPAIVREAMDRTVAVLSSKELHDAIEASSKKDAAKRQAQAKAQAKAGSRKR